EATERLAHGYLDLADLGEFEVKGASQPVKVFELRGIGAARSRLDLSRERGFSRFVGRAREMAILEQALTDADEGRGCVIGIVADAGVGKSRLCHEFAERCRARFAARSRLQRRPAADLRLPRDSRSTAARATDERRSTPARLAGGGPAPD